MKEQILSLEHTDDLHSLRDKITRAQVGRLVLLWPALEEPVARRLDLVLMSRWAAMAGSELVIVSADEEVRRLARSAGIPCHPDLKASALAGLSTRSADWKKPEPFRRARRPPARPLPNGRRNPLPMPLRIGLFAAAVLSIAAVFLLLLPSVRMRAVFPSRTVEASATLDPSMCAEMILRLSVSDRRATTGRILTPTAYATGDVTLTNISNRVLNLSAGLRVASENDIIFETVDGLILPPGKSQTAAVRAMEPGPSANLATGRVNRILGPLALSLKASNLKPISGGAEAWRSAVSQTDLDALQSALSDRARRDTSAGLQNLAGESRMVVEESLRVIFEPQDAPDLSINAPADSVGLTLHAAASVLACPGDKIRSRAEEILRSQLHPGEALSGQILNLRLLAVAGGGIDLIASGQAVTIPDRNDMVLALRAQTPAQAASILRRRFLARDVRAVELSPAWIPLLPLFPYQIEIFAEAE